MSIQNNVSSVGKLIVRFPADFETPFNQIKCTAKLNFNKNGPIICSYDPQVRILTLTDGFPLKARFFEFSVSGIQNPVSSGTSGLYSVGTYVRQNNSWLQVETEDRELTTTTTPGILQNESLNFLNNLMAGQYSTLTFKAKVQHVVPKDGSLVVTMPKWNPEANKDSLFESYVSAPSNPGQVKCQAVSGIELAKPSDLYCVFKQNDKSDELKVIFQQSGVLKDIPAETELIFTVDQVRGPPTTSIQTGFAFATLSKNGNYIDQSNTTKQIILQVSQPLEGSPAQIAITADNPSINVSTGLNFEIRTTNPLPPHSNVQITFPTDMDITNISSVRGNGSLRNVIENFQLDQDSRVLTINDVNDEYIQSFVFIFLSINSVVNPPQTFRTGTFAIQISDSKGGKIETVNEGLYFTATAGQLSSVAIQSDDYMINQKDVTYTFSFTANDSFSSDAILKLTLPDQIQGDEMILTQSKNMSQNALLDFQFGKYILIANGFPDGYKVSSNQMIQFSLKGFTNPPTIKRTDPFELAIFYEEGKNEVSRYSGDELTITAEPSPMINMHIQLSSQNPAGKTTGFINTNFTVSAETVEGRPIQMGSYLQLFIPVDFKILDLDRTASSCTVISGFSDEITCSFVEANNNGYVIKVKGGFDSKTSTGGKLSFFMQGILNPFTTLQTAQFQMEIYDIDGGMQYIYQDVYKVQVEPSLFSYAYAESQSPVVGQSSVYQLSLTLSVDTPAGAILQVSLPTELEFDQDRSFYCIAETNVLPLSLPCEKEDNQRAIITLSENSLGSLIARNGTTITVDLGYIKNPPSQKPTASFNLLTYEVDGENKYLINRASTGISVQSPQVGAVTITDVAQTGSKELGRATALKLIFKTQNPIPVGSQLQVTLSNNFVLDEQFEVTLNGVEVEVEVNRLAFSFTMQYASGLNRRLQQATASQDFVLEIKKGLKNPTIGPYRYNYYNIQFSTEDGFGIDGSINKKEWIFQDCIGECNICQQTLDNCTSCGLDRKTGTISFYFKDNLCWQKCPPGFYGAPGYTCKPCEYPCTECNMAANLCTRCSKNFSRPLANPLTLQCYAECPDGTYEDVAEQQCLPCKEPCYTCTSATQCLSCDRTKQSNKLINFFEKEKTCYETCPAISVPTPSKKCLACTNNCLTCEGITNKCITCEDGFYLFKNTCVSVCPFGYVYNEQTKACGSAGKLQLPIPFTIIALVISFGIAISTCLKGSDRQGRVQQGTAFFITVLALVDILLRINWIVLIIYLYLAKHLVTAGLYLVLIFASLIINFCLWRRMFYSKYKYEERDRQYGIYFHNYPNTAKFVQNLSYIISFQAIRLSYSRILGKKQFMARFSTRRRFYRLIGRLSIIEILVLYLPSFAINISNLYYVKFGTQLFYFDIDSLILVAYAVILIIVVLSQKERLIDQSKLFQWRDLFTNEDFKEENEAESSYGDSKGFNLSGGIAQDEQIEVNSAMDYGEKQKVKMYQLEWQFNSESNKDRENFSPAKVWRDKVRPVSVFDYNEYRKLEDKKDRIALKKELYERKKAADEIRIRQLKGEKVVNDETHQDLVLKISDLTAKLKEIKRQIQETENSRMKEVRKAEQSKREQIIKKQGFEVPSINAAADRSMRKASQPKNIHIDHATEYANQFSPRNPNKFIKRSTSQNSQISMELFGADAGQPVMSSAEQFTLNRQQKEKVVDNTIQSSVLDTVEYSADYSLEQVPIATNEEGLVDSIIAGEQVDTAMMLQNQHLTAGASFGENKQ